MYMIVVYHWHHESQQPRTPTECLVVQFANMINAACAIDIQIDDKSSNENATGLNLVVLQSWQPEETWILIDTNQWICVVT